MFYIQYQLALDAKLLVFTSDSDGYSRRNKLKMSTTIVRCLELEQARDDILLELL